MGAWGTGLFANDNALDFVGELCNAGTKPQFLTDTINAALAGEIVSASVEASALAACAVVVAAASEPVRGVNKKAKEWIQTSGYVPNREELAVAERAITKISEKSELRELWEDPRDLKKWQAGNHKLLLAIREAVPRDLPRRVAKPPGMPRLLWKQLELYERCPTPKLKDAIQRKLDSQTDLNKITPETGIYLPLVLVIKHGFFEEAKKLILRGANPSLKEIRFGTPPAYLFACIKGDLSLVEFIFSRGVSPFSFYAIDPKTNSIIQSDNLHDFKSGIVPTCYSPCLFAALKRGHLDVAKHLISLGADLQEHFFGETALHRAVASGDAATVDFVIQGGVDLHSTSRLKETALHVIFEAKRNRCAIAKMLIDAGVGLNLADKFGMTVLDSALDRGDAELAAFLESMGAKRADGA